MPTFKSYLTGFILSIALTLIAYFAVTNHAPSVILVILSLAIVQFIIQLIFFLHITQGPDKQWNLVVFISTLSIVLIVVVGSIWIMDHLNYNMTPSQMNDYVIKTEGIHQVQKNISLKFTPNNYKSFDILSDGQLIKTITLNDIPAFDEGDPKQDYQFSNDWGQNDIYDALHNQVYFTAYNLITAGNANAVRALFAYNLTNSKITIIYKTDFSVSFGVFKLSPNNKYLVFSDGSHGGFCYNTLGLTILDLDSNKELNKIFLPIDRVGIIEFEKWVDNDSFNYKEETYKNINDCIKNYEKPTVTVKLFKIPTQSNTQDESMQKM